MTRAQCIGVIDRFEDDVAVVLLEQDGNVVDEQGIDRDNLPAGGDHVDAVFQITRDDSGAILELEYDAETTRTRKDRAQSRFDRLAERPPSDDES
ncbi:DUF3006 domain-containing protein [Halorubrum ezzemoulense]|uniref:DUF3006 domain-containing protein n=1 Tax=Halorubrum ezzemoulense TaxID=337243 RepID=UPI00232C0D35|nr:DUF3006 domain-containing protein [Halorubrum ezzemoulense]MDB2242658.1 DUF3006 domain-containing protein [Halorubrum ezzemoulense]